MPINQLSTANTFSQWLGATQSLIDKSNYYEYTTNTVFNTANSVALLNMAITNTSNSINAQTAIITATSVSINNTSNLVNAQTSVVLSTSNNIYAYVNAAYDTANAIYTIVANTEVATITDDNTTNNSYSILLSQNTSGGLLRTNVSSQKLSFNPGTGRLTTNVVNSTFITSNTTLVTNLNADYLDGQHGSYFAPLSGPTFTGTVTLPSSTSIGTVSNTEIGYLDGVTSSIQTQLGSKAPLASPTFTGTVVLPSTTSIGTVSSTEIGYLDGITSSIQTQLGSKASLISPTFTGAPLSPTAATGTSNTMIATTAFVNDNFLRKGTYTNVATTSGSAIDITGIPSSTTKISLFLSGVSTNASSALIFQSGSGSIETSNYYGACDSWQSSPDVAGYYGSGFEIPSSSPGAIIHGVGILENIKGNLWSFTFIGKPITDLILSTGYKTFSGIIDRIRFTTITGTSTFDLGSIYIKWE